MQLHQKRVTIEAGTAQVEKVIWKETRMRATSYTARDLENDRMDPPL